MAKKQARKAKKPTKRAAKKPVAKARKASRPTKRHAPRKTAKARPATRKAARPKAVKKAVRKVAKAFKKIARPVAKKAIAAKPRPAAKPVTAAKKAAIVHPPTLERKRLQLPEAERLAGQNPTAGNCRTASGCQSGDDHMMSAAKAGHDSMQQKQARHTETSPVLTGGDVDADWQDAYATGDESPGGDNPTPDQNRVDLIGKALGVEYGDEEELEGGEELADRDEHRWELDPESDDWPRRSFESA